ncbi:MAG: hypothetical protein QG616_2074 [Pseudomonadota bacterium]|nr:hypothetical protein [Pseudomonadota bacterium]
MWPDVQKDLTPVRRKRINRNATERNLDVACRNKDLAVFRRANPTPKHDPPPSLVPLRTCSDNGIVCGCKWKSGLNLKHHTEPDPKLKVRKVGVLSTNSENREVRALG